jgi:HK97 family phage major capsid protein
LAVLCKYSSEIAEDAVISIADDLAMEIAYAFADKEDECGFNGDGTSTYGGIVGLKNAVLAGSKYTAITGNTAFSTLDLDDFEAMVGKLPQFAVGGAAWYISRVGWANSMLRLAEAAGGNTTAQIAQGAALQFLGFPVVISQVLNSTTSAQTSTDGICYLANLDMGASFGSRRGVSIAVDGSRFFESDQLAVRGTERFDINVHEKGTSSVAGPIIMMSTPSS